MIVLDASAAVEWLLGLPRAAAVEARFVDADVTLHAPHLLTIEVAQVVRRFAARGEISAERGAQVLDDLTALDLHLYDHRSLLPLVWSLRANLTAYDASYLALADVLDAPLVTLDAGLAATPLGRVTIDLIS